MRKIGFEIRITVNKHILFQSHPHIIHISPINHGFNFILLWFLISVSGFLLSFMHASLAFLACSFCFSLQISTYLWRFWLDLILNKLGFLTDEHRLYFLKREKDKISWPCKKNKILEFQRLRKLRILDQHDHQILMFRTVRPCGHEKYSGEIYDVVYVLS